MAPLLKVRLVWESALNCRYQFSSDEGVELSVAIPSGFGCSPFFDSAKEIWLDPSLRPSSCPEKIIAPARVVMSMAASCFAISRSWVPSP